MMERGWSAHEKIHLEAPWTLVTKMLQERRPNVGEVKTKGVCAIPCAAAPLVFHPEHQQCSLKRRAMLNADQPIAAEKRDLFSGHAHVVIDSGRKRGESSAAQCSRLWTRFIRKSSSCYTTGSNGILEIRLCPKPFNTALGPRVDCPDEGEIFGGRVGSRAHVFEAPAELFPNGEVGQCLSLWSERRIVGHLCEWQQILAAASP
jgi:hypothetical protein